MRRICHVMVIWVDCDWMSLHDFLPVDCVDVERILR